MPKANFEAYVRPVDVMPVPLGHEPILHNLWTLAKTYSSERTEPTEPLGMFYNFGRFKSAVSHLGSSPLDEPQLVAWYVQVDAQVGFFSGKRLHTPHRNGN